METDQIATLTLTFVLIGILIVVGIVIFNSTSNSTQMLTNQFDQVNMTGSGSGATGSLTKDYCQTVTGFTVNADSWPLP